MTSKELVPTGDTTFIVPRVVASALERLEEADPSEAKAIREDADALLTILRARNQALADLNQVAELKLRAERRIGEERRQLPSAANGLGFDWDHARELTEAGVPRKEIARVSRCDS